LYYQATVSPRVGQDGNIQITMQNGMSINGGLFQTQVNTSVFNKKTLAAKNVLQSQLQLLVTSNDYYINMFKQGQLPYDKFNIWETFRTDVTGPNGNSMLRLMQFGCVKAFGDLFQEILGIAAQLPVYRGNYPAQISPKGINIGPVGRNGFTSFENDGRDRLLIQAGTDRPSAIGRASMFSLFGNPNEINKKAFVGYSTNSDNFFYVRPLFISQSGGKNKNYKKYKSKKNNVKKTQKRKTQKRKYKNIKNFIKSNK
jgi:hypothetical protein